MDSLPLSLTLSWPLMVVTGTGLFFVLAGREGIRRGLPPADWFAALALGTLGALVGARLGTLDPVEGVTSGRTILGVIAGAVVGFAAAARWLRLSRGSVDAVAVAAPVGMAVGRIGCILAGCCRGRPTELPWGVAPRKDLPGEEILHAGVHLHPVQAYELILVALLALGLSRLAPRTATRPGLLFTLFVAGYGIVRWGTEFFRYRSELVLGHSGPQAVAGLAAVVAGLLAWRLWRQGPLAFGSAKWKQGPAASNSGRRYAAASTGLIAPALISLPLIVVILMGSALAPWERLILVGVSALGVWGLMRGSGGDEAARAKNDVIRRRSWSLSSGRRSRESRARWRIPLNPVEGRSEVDPGRLASRPSPQFTHAPRSPIRRGPWPGGSVASTTSRRIPGSRSGS